MTQFCLAHPWMTFWLLVLCILTIDSIFSYFSPYCKCDDSEEEK